MINRQKIALKKNSCSHECFMKELDCKGSMVSAEYAGIRRKYWTSVQVIVSKEFKRTSRCDVKHFYLEIEFKAVAAKKLKGK